MYDHVQPLRNLCVFKTSEASDETYNSQVLNLPPAVSRAIRPPRALRQQHPRRFAPPGDANSVLASAAKLAHSFARAEILSEAIALRAT